MTRFVVLWLAACTTTSAPPSKPPPAAPDPVIKKAELAAAHRILEGQQQDALAATCVQPDGKPRCLPSCYANEPADPRATKKPPAAIAIEHVVCEKRDGSFTLGDEIAKPALRVAREIPRPNKPGTWQAKVERAVAGFARRGRGDVVVATGTWREVEHPVTKERLRCVTVSHYARGMRTLDACGGDGAIGCEANGDASAHGINVVHYRLAEARRLQAAGKPADCEKAAREAVAVARGLPRWRQYMQLNVAKWKPYAAYRTRFDGLLDEDTLFTTAIALGKEAEAVFEACSGGTRAVTTAGDEQSFHMCW